MESFARPPANALKALPRFTRLAANTVRPVAMGGAEPINPSPTKMPSIPVNPANACSRLSPLNR